MGLLDILLPSQYPLSEDERKRLKKTGLLEAGLRMLATPTGTGSPVMGVAGGLLDGLHAMQLGAQNNFENDYRDRALLEHAYGGIPAELQTFQGMTQGMGDDDVAKARRIALGLDPRASSGLPFGFQVVTGADGISRLVQVDKRDGGAAEIGPGGVPVGAGAGTPPSGKGPMDRGAAMSVVQHLEESQGVQFPPPMRLKMISELMMGQPMSGQVPSGPSPYASRPAEQQAALTAAATDQAKVNVALGNAPAVNANEAALAAAKAQAAAQGQAAGERSAAVAQRTQNAGRALGLLDEVDRLLPTATGGKLGTMRDDAAAMFNVSTKGAQGTSALHTISGQLVAMMPRMEGPQSDKDVLLYRQMAGDLANSLLPVETRQAAAKELRRLQQKYAGGQAAPANPAHAGFKVLD